MKAFTATLIACAALPAATFATAVDTARRDTATLRATQEKLARAADRTKGGPRQSLLLEQRRLGHLIEDLEQGRPVDPAEIDRALGDAERGTW